MLTTSLAFTTLLMGWLTRLALSSDAYSAGVCLGLFLSAVHRRRWWLHKQEELSLCCWWSCRFQRCSCIGHDSGHIYQLHPNEQQFSTGMCDAGMFCFKEFWNYSGAAEGSIFQVFIVSSYIQVIIAHFRSKTYVLRTWISTINFYLKSFFE